MALSWFLSNLSQQIIIIDFVTLLAMEHERETHKALYLIVFCLYLLPILSLGEDAITVYLYATKQLDDVALLSLVLVFAGVSFAKILQCVRL